MTISTPKKELKIYPKRNSNEADEAIKDLLENISNLQEEIRKLKREQEI